MRELSAACTELADQLDVFTDNDVTSDRADAGLLTSTLLVVDQDAEPGTGRRTVPATRTPGNTQALNAEMDAHALVRRLEASLRLVVTGHTGRMRGGSDSSTRAAIAAIEKLGEAVSPHARQLAARLLDRATTTIGQLPSIDEIPRWEKIRPGPGGLPPTCPNCETFSLRVALSAGVVVCVFPGCEDMDGRRPPQARMDLSKIDGRPVLVWRDGLVQLLRLLTARDTHPLTPLRAEHRRPLLANFTLTRMGHVYLPVGWAFLVIVRARRVRAVIRATRDVRAPPHRATWLRHSPAPHLVIRYVAPHEHVRTNLSPPFAETTSWPFLR